MKAKYFSIMIVGLLFMSVIAAFTASLPPEEPEPTALPDFDEVYITPEHPIGHDWVTQQGGDLITAYGYVSDPSVASMELATKFCNHLMCPAPPPNVVMTPVPAMGSGWFSGQFPGDHNLVTPTYDASNRTEVYVKYKLIAKDGGGIPIAEYPGPLGGLNWIEFYPAWPPSQINATSAVSNATVFPGTTFWVNGTSNYFNSTSKPKDIDPGMNTMINASECNVTISINPEFTGKTDEFGNYSILVTAPMTPGLYTVNTTVSNSTPNRNVTCVSSNITIEVLDINVTLELNTTTTLPGLQLLATGTSLYSDGSFPVGSGVNVTITETGAYWNDTKINATGGFSVDFTAPGAVGDYHLNVMVHNSTYNLTATNQTTFTVVAVPLADLVVTTADIAVEGSLIEGLTHYINVTVQNKGIAAAANALVNTSINGVLKNSTRVTIPVAGSSTIPLEWLPEPGDNNISVIVDPADDITESSETNNTAWKMIQILADYDGDGDPDNTDTDDDNDDYLDVWEVFLGTDPFNTTDKPLDTDGDGEPDGDAGNTEAWMDLDDDDDLVNDADDAFPTNSAESTDFDDDGIGDNADDDDDSDGYLDATDDPELRDTDNDGLTNDLDPDDDADGIPDVDDSMPYDTDNDGQRNSADPDDDDDGLQDIAEDVNWNGLVDEGETDYLNEDTDGDGVNDRVDYAPLDPAITVEPAAKSNAFLIVVSVVIIIAVVIGLLVFLKFMGPSKPKEPGMH